jgi:eukaryotic-like serine/threonine-protein kinase
MGQIWAARRTGRLGTLVAVKTALVETGDKLEELFFDEARVAVSIDHPNVCRTFELGEDHGLLFLAMEWIEGASLWELFKALPTPRRLESHIAAYAVACACSGLHAAHELRDDDGTPLNVVHRDATPHNILISRNGDVKVVDFGVVKSRNQLHATVTGEFKGKINYLAPEQILSKDVDRRTDVFALGCVLYVLTTGERPFQSDNAGGTMLHIVNGTYSLPSVLVPSYPPELESIIVRALARDPDRRFPSADALRLALESFLVTSGAPPVGRDDLASLLQTHLGDMLKRRQEQIRAAQRRLVVAGGSVAPVSDGLSELPGPVGTANASCSESLGTAAPVALSRPRPARRFALYAAIATLLAASPFAALRVERPSAAPAPAAALQTPIIPSVTPARSPAPSPLASAPDAGPGSELTTSDVRAAQDAVVAEAPTQRPPVRARQWRRSREAHDSSPSTEKVSASAATPTVRSDPFTQPMPPRKRRTIDESDPFRE